MKNYDLPDNFWAGIRGEFSPAQFSSRLFFERSELETPENYLVWFHERFHYLQSIFTPYGQLKWGTYRSVTTETLDLWETLPTKYNCAHQIPIAAYLRDKSVAGLHIAGPIWMQDFILQIYNTIEYGTELNCTDDDCFTFIKNNTTLPKINLQGRQYTLRGIDILESFAKFEEALMGELIIGRPIAATIDADRLNPEYYSALYYFIDSLGVEHLAEFPIICELALATPHIPTPQTLKSFQLNSPSWRFEKIVSTLKTEKSKLPPIDFQSNDSFYAYTNSVLSLCNYETFDTLWNVAESYVAESDLSMAIEMKAAIEYKKAHPWMLSYPMADSRNYFSDSFNRFQPYFTITEDGVMYNSEKISPTELMLENHIQALAFQIIGKLSKYCCEASRIACGYTYTGANSCPHFIRGECEGYVDAESCLPKCSIDSAGDIQSGCTFELLLNMHNISIQDVHVEYIRSLKFNELSDVAKEVFSKK